MKEEGEISENCTSYSTIFIIKSISLQILLYPVINHIAVFVIVPKPVSVLRRESGGG